MKFLLFIAFCLLASHCFAQKTLVLQRLRANKVKENVFYTKDEIKFKLKGNHQTRSGVIMAIGDSALILAKGKHQDTIAYRNIRMVIFNRSNNITAAFSNAFFISGIGIILLDSFNNIINDEASIVKPKIVQVGLGLMAVAAIIKFCERKRCKLGKNTQLRVINLSPY